MLVQLGWKLHKVSYKAAIALILHILHKRRKTVAKLVEIGFHLVCGEQSGLVSNRSCKVAHNGYYRNHTFAILIVLISVAAAPGAASLVARTCKHIKEDQSYN